MKRKPLFALTPLTRRVWDAAHAFYRETGHMPTLRELGARLDMAATANVAYHLDNLVAAGWLIVRTTQHTSKVHGPRPPRVWSLKGEGTEPLSQ